MLHFNKFTIVFIIAALVAMYAQSMYVEVMCLFFAYLTHYPNGDVYVEENNEDDFHGLT